MEKPLELQHLLRQKKAKDKSHIEVCRKP